MDAPDQVFLWSDPLYSGGLTSHAASNDARGKFQRRYVLGEIFDAMKARAEKAEAAMRGE